MESFYHFLLLAEILTALYTKWNPDVLKVENVVV